MKNVHTITIKLEGADWEKILDSTFKKKNSNANIPGFRKGKAPKNVYLQHFGIESLFMDAVDAALPVAYTRILEENKLIPVIEPKVDIKSIDEKQVEIEFTIITKPEVKISSYKNLGVKKSTPKVTKKEIDAEINSLRDRFAEIIEKENGVVANGDIAVIDFEGFVEGKAFDGGKGTDYELEIGSNTFIPGFEDALIGAKTGEKRDVNVKFPDDYTPELKGKDAVFKCVVNKIKARILPELNEEFFKDLGYDDVKTKEELENKIKDHLMEHKLEDAENEYTNALIDAAVKNMTVEINDEIVDAELERLVNDFNERMQMQGFSLEQYFSFTGSSMEDFKEKSKPDAINRIKSRYLLDEIISKEKLEATNDEVEAHAKEQAEKYHMDASELISMYGGMDVVKYDLLIHKAIKILGQ